MKAGKEKLLTEKIKKSLTVIVLSTALFSCGDNVRFENMTEKLEVIHLTQSKADRSVDILVVIDNSPSMREEQKRLGARFGDFMSSLRRIRWQIGFINTDASKSSDIPGWGGRLYNLRGRSDYILTPRHPSPARLFRETVSRYHEMQDCGRNARTPCPSNTEEPLKATIQAIRQHKTHNTGFFRPNANLAILVLSDENERSNGGRNATRPRAVINAVRQEFGRQKSFSAYGMIIRPGDERCLRQQGLSSDKYGTFVQDLANKTDGITGSICSSDYASALRAISRRIESQLTIQSIPLNHEPKEDSLVVNFIPQSRAVPWKIEDNTIVFEEPPAEGTQIRVEYVYQAFY